jgi:hypothetical protein
MEDGEEWLDLELQRFVDGPLVTGASTSSPRSLRTSDLAEMRALLQTKLADVKVGNRMDTQSTPRDSCVVGVGAGTVHRCSA